MSVLVRAATIEDLPAITEILNHYIVHTHITFDVEPHRVEDRAAWFHEHCDGQRYRTLVACDAGGSVIGYTCTGRFRTKAAYDTTVEASIGCHPNAVCRGIGTLLYGALFKALADEDIHRIVAGIAQPNTPSNALHEKFGFKRVGLYSEVGRKFGKYWDVLWMERPLQI